MSYQYEEFKDWTLSDDGQRAVCAALIRAQKLHKTAGAFIETRITEGLVSDSWKMLAITDRLEEMGYISQITPSTHRPRFYQYEEP